MAVRFASIAKIALAQNRVGRSHPSHECVQGETDGLLMLRPAS